jgi:hypothetical protein
MSELASEAQEGRLRSSSEKLHEQRLMIEMDRRSVC